VRYSFDNNRSAGNAERFILYALFWSSSDSSERLKFGDSVDNLFKKVLKLIYFVQDNSDFDDFS